MNLNDEKWLYSLETILYNKKTTTILNNKSILLILIMEVLKIDKSLINLQLINKSCKTLLKKIWRVPVRVRLVDSRRFLTPTRRKNPA